jgi:hypothetical protein
MRAHFSEQAEPEIFCRFVRPAMTYLAYYRGIVPGEESKREMEEDERLLFLMASHRSFPFVTPIASTLFMYQYLPSPARVETSVRAT